MKYYLVLSKSGMYKGYTTDSSLMRMFLEQRNPKDYTVKICKEKELSKDFIKELHSSWTEIVIEEGVALCASEEEYFIEALGQFFIDVRCKVGYLRQYFPYLRLSDKEEKIINEALNLMVEYINAADCYYEDNEDECVDQDKYLKMDMMIKFIIDILN